MGPAFQESSWRRGVKLESHLYQTKKPNLTTMSLTPVQSAAPQAERERACQRFGGSFDLVSGQTISTTALISSVTVSRTGVSTTYRWIACNSAGISSLPQTTRGS